VRFALWRFTQQRPFWQLAPVITPQSCGRLKLMARAQFVWRLWRATATGLPLWRFTLRRPFWQPAAATIPRSCGCCRSTTRQRLVWRLWRGTATLFGLLRFIPLRPFWQLAPATIPRSYGNKYFVAFHSKLPLLATGSQESPFHVALIN
jgi:hypothetical protein